MNIFSTLKSNGWLNLTQLNINNKHSTNYDTVVNELEVFKALHKTFRYTSKTFDELYGSGYTLMANSYIKNFNLEEDFNKFIENINDVKSFYYIATGDAKKYLASKSETLDSKEEIEKYESAFQIVGRYNDLLTEFRSDVLLYHDKLKDEVVFLYQIKKDVLDKNKEVIKVLGHSWVSAGNDYIPSILIEFEGFKFYSLPILDELGEDLGEIKPITKDKNAPSMSINQALSNIKENSKLGESLYIVDRVAKRKKDAYLKFLNLFSDETIRKNKDIIINVNKIEKLFASGITGYRLKKETGLTQQNMDKYIKMNRGLDEMNIRTAIILTEYINKQDL